MDFDTKTYILLGGCLLIGLVLLHGFWLAWRTRRPVPILDGGQGQQLPLEVEAALLGDPDNGSAMQRAEPAAEVPEDPTQPARAALARRQQLVNGGRADAPPRRGRRIEIAGKRTEPTVPRTSRRFTARSAAPARVAPVAAPPRSMAEEAPALENGNGTDDAPEAAPADEVLVLWVVAKPEATLGGATLLQTFAAAGLEYDGQVFRGASADGGRFTVANGVEPGTFDLSDIEAFAARSVVFLLRLSAAGDPAAAFDAMLETAQALAADADAELKDEQRSDVSGQTIVYYRQRIDDFKHKSMRG